MWCLFWPTKRTVPKRSFKSFYHLLSSTTVIPLLMLGLLLETRSKLTSAGDSVEVCEKLLITRWDTLVVKMQVKFKFSCKHFTKCICFCTSWINLTCTGKFYLIMCEFRSHKFLNMMNDGIRLVSAGQDCKCRSWDRPLGNVSWSFT